MKWPMLAKNPLYCVFCGNAMSFTGPPCTCWVRDAKFCLLPIQRIDRLVRESDAR